jgi:hypothetical protein
MKTLARIIFMLMAFVPVARIGADDVQRPGLFDQVREAIPKLKTGMGYEDVCRILMTKKLTGGLVYGGSSSSHDLFWFPGRSDQTLRIDWHPSTSNGAVYKVELYDRKRRVAKFEVDIE